MNWAVSFPFCHRISNGQFRATITWQFPLTCWLLGWGWVWVNAVPKVIENSFLDQISHDNFRQNTMVKILPTLLFAGLHSLQRQAGSRPPVRVRLGWELKHNNRDFFGNAAGECDKLCVVFVHLQLSQEDCMNCCGLFHMHWTAVLIYDTLF